jgi:hypothetical protein
MGVLPDRNLQSEAAKHFKGTPAERLESALRLGREALVLYLAAHPEMTESEARKVLRRNKHAGRRPSRVMDGASS